MQREGYQDGMSCPWVSHRRRESRQSKYTNLGRLWASLSDLVGVVWLQSRSRNPGGVDEVWRVPHRWGLSRNLTY